MIQRSGQHSCISKTGVPGNLSMTTLSSVTLCATHMHAGSFTMKTYLPSESTSENTLPAFFFKHVCHSCKTTVRRVQYENYVLGYVWSTMDLSKADSYINIQSLYKRHHQVMAKYQTCEQRSIAISTTALFSASCIATVE